MNISQSGIKDYFYPWGGGSLCPAKWKAKNIDKLGYNDSTEAQTLGHIFEHELLGDSSGEVPHLPLKKDGGMRKAEEDVRALASYARERLFPLYGFSVLETQVYLKADGLSGAADAIIEVDGKPALLDVKFTGEANNQFNPWNLGGEYSKQFDRLRDCRIQACHYVHLYHELHGEYIPFYFFVMGKSGWHKTFKMEIQSSTMASHLELVNILRKNISQHEQDGWPTNPDYKTCKDCPIRSTCKDSILIPQIQTITI